jgi:hypothetical protein
MNITVNGAIQGMPASVDLSSSKNQTLGQIYAELVKSLVQSGKMVTSVEVNGERLEGGRIWDLASLPIAQVEALDIVTKEATDMVHEIMSSADIHLEHLIDLSEKTATLYRVGNELSAHEQFGQCVSSLQWFLKSLNVLRGFLSLDFESLVIGNISVEKSLQELVPLMDELLQAQADGDVIRLADLLEYELVTKVRQWRTNLPELTQKALTSFKFSQFPA